ncbi:MAG: hypothetical protein AB7G87_14855, partial [Clostridia bacterium]
WRHPDSCGFCGFSSCEPVPVPGLFLSRSQCPKNTLFVGNVTILPGTDNIRGDEGKGPEGRHPQVG